MSDFENIHDINKQQKDIFIQEKYNRLREKEEIDKLERENKRLLSMKYKKRPIEPKPEAEYRDMRDYISEVFGKREGIAKTFFELSKDFRSQDDKDRLKHMLSKMTTEKILKYTNYTKQYSLK